jgi:hypothetical protein
MFIARAGVLLAAATAHASDPWADSVVSYVEGAGVSSGYNTPATALGEPTRFTGVGAFPGAVTPFNPAFLGSELVSIGTGGHLIVRFDEPVIDDPSNPFGIDLLVFGNSGYEDAGFPAGINAGLFGGGEGGVIEVSADGSNWFTVTGVGADAEFPTLGYLDLTDPYATSPGTALSDFTRPVDPALNTLGMSFAQIVAAYGGSGGGAGVDLSSVGLAAISFVRITPGPGAAIPDIDGFADVSPVPAPGAVALLAVSLGVGRGRRRPMARRISARIGARGATA